MVLDMLRRIREFNERHEDTMIEVFFAVVVGSAVMIKYIEWTQ